MARGWARRHVQVAIHDLGHVLVGHLEQVVVGRVSHNGRSHWERLAPSQSGRWSALDDLARLLHDGQACQDQLQLRW